MAKSGHLGNPGYGLLWLSIGIPWLFPKTWTRGRWPSGSWTSAWLSAGSEAVKSGRSMTFASIAGRPSPWGWVEGETIVCAYHGWAYDADGKCVRIPSIPPEHPIPKKACLTHYPAAERYGIIWV